MTSIIFTYNDKVVASKRQFCLNNNLKYSALQKKALRAKELPVTVMVNDLPLVITTEFKPVLSANQKLAIKIEELKATVKALSKNNTK